MIGDEATRQYIANYEILYSYNNMIFFEAKDTSGNHKV
jgi:hypothetical protein